MPDDIQYRSLDLKLSDKDLSKYSISRAIAAMSRGVRDGFEFDLSQELESRIGGLNTHGGILVPDEVLAKRDLSVSGGTTQVVATNLMAGDFISLLRNATQVGALGARIMGGLVGNVAIPRQTGAASASWTATDTTAQSESDQSFDQVTMSPLNLTGFTKFS